MIRMSTLMRYMKMYPLQVVVTSIPATSSVCLYLESFFLLRLRSQEQEAQLLL